MLSANVTTLGLTDIKALAQFMKPTLRCRICMLTLIYFSEIFPNYRIFYFLDFFPTYTVIWTLHLFDTLE